MEPLDSTGIRHIFKVCTVSFGTEDEILATDANKDQQVVLNELSENSFQVLKDELNIVESGLLNKSGEIETRSSWKDSCVLDDPTLVRNGVEAIRPFLSKKWRERPFHFIFTTEEKSDCDQNRNKTNNNTNYKTVNGHGFNTEIETFQYPDKIIKVEKHDSVSSTENSVFGSPLKLEPIGNLSFNETESDCLTPTNGISEPQCSPLSGLQVQSSRNIISQFCRVWGKEREEESAGSLLESIVILCDGLDAGKTILLGAHCSAESLETRRVTTFKTTACSKKCNISFLERPNLSQGNVCYMASLFEFVDQHRDKGRQLDIEAQWKDSSGSPTISVLNSAQFSLRLRLPFGDSESQLLQQQQMKLLKQVMTMCKGLEDGRVPVVLSNKPFDVHANTLHFFSQVKNGLHEGVSQICGKSKRLDLISSESTDVTDCLWELFIQCQNYQDVITCLKTTFVVLKKNEFPLFVREDNNTILASLVRQASQGWSYFPSLTDLMPLKIVAEVGLERMRKVYSDIMIRNKLCSSDDLNNFFKLNSKHVNGGSGSNNMNTTVSRIEQDDTIPQWYIKAVMKLCHCLDLVCLVDQHMDYIDLKPVAGKILSHYSSHTLDEEHVFVISLDTRQASKEVEKLSPLRVRREYKTGNDKTRVDCLLSDVPDCVSVPVWSYFGDVTDSNLSVSLAKDTLKGESYRFKTEQQSLVFPCSLTT